jgi:hypothetical protein
MLNTASKILKLRKILDNICEILISLLNFPLSSGRELSLLIPKKILFNKYDFMISPTKNENFGIATLESMGRGLSVLTTNKTPWNSIKKIMLNGQLTILHRN